MKFTLSWLKDFLDTDSSLDIILNKLNSIGLEVESINDNSKNLSDFIIAKILDAQPHPDASKLQICLVNNGKETLQIVCGAPNARAGLYVVLAPIGTIIPTNNLKIKATKIRGVDSKGMLCSSSELGLGKDQDGIIEIPAIDENIGHKYIDFAGLKDPVIEVAITPNRSDCFSVYGIARDLVAAGLGKLKDISIKELSTDSKSPIKVQIDDSDICSLFVGRYFKNVSNPPSPQWLKKRLESIGVNSISALVDITNYINLTYGRPLHVYDADKLEGNLIVRNAKNQESINALNNKEYKLDQAIPIIADSIYPQAIAGIIGGNRACCSAETKNIFLEVALFDKIKTSASGRKLDIISDSRTRFERGIDPDFVIPALHLTSQMIVDICGGSPSEIVQSGDYEPGQLKQIEFDPNYVKKLVNIDLDNETINSILTKLGFIVAGNKVTIPSWRHDITNKADIVEEVARIYGYEHIKPVPLPITKTIPVKYDDISAARTKLVTLGMNEAITWSFMSSVKAELFYETNPVLELINPISSDLNYMRPSILPNLLDAVVLNVSRGTSDLAIFEIGNIYRGTKSDQQIPTVTGIRSGKYTSRNIHGNIRDVDVFDIKLDVYKTLAALNISSSGLKIETSAPKYYHPGRSGVVILGNKILAYFGQIHPQICKRFTIDLPIVGFEIFLNNLPPQKQKTSLKKKLHLSEYQLSVRDFAFIIDEKVSAYNIISTIEKVDKELVESVNLFDLYQGKNIEFGKKSLAFSVRIRAKDHTLTESELENLSSKIIQAITALGGTLR